MGNAPEFGQGEGVLSKAAGMVQEAHGDFNRISKKLEGQIAGVQGKWGGAGATAFFTLNQAWQEKQTVIVKALNDFEASLVGSEKDNVATDDTEGANYNRLSGRLG